MRRFGLVLVLLVLVVVLGLLVRADPAPGLDRAVGEACREGVPAALSGALRATSEAIQPPRNHWIALALGVVAGIGRGWRAGLYVLLVSLLVMLVVEGIKPAFGRLRPEASAPFGAERSALSYVSGHVAWTTATLGAFAVATTRSLRWRLPALLAVGLLTAWVAIGRIHLGRHHLTDAAGAVLLAVAALLALGGLLPGGLRRRACREPRTDAPARARGRPPPPLRPASNPAGPRPAR